jgi:hypothetical protein
MYYQGIYGVTDENHIRPVRVVRDPSRIRIVHLPNKNLRSYCYIGLLSNSTLFNSTTCLCPEVLTVVFWVMTYYLADGRIILPPISGKISCQDKLLSFLAHIIFHIISIFFYAKKLSKLFQSLGFRGWR